MTMPLAATSSADDTAPSPGCGTATAQQGTSTRQFAAAGKTGHYILDVPAGADKPTAVVVDLHGYLEPAALQRAGSGIGPFGSAHGFITATPELNEPGLPRWDFGVGSTDIVYLSDLLTHLESTLCVDERRVYVTGLSMGAFTTSSLACQLSERLAAIAPVAGLQDFDRCETKRPVPVIAFHGTTDPIVAYTGGPGPHARFLPSPDGSLPSGQEGGRPNVNGPGPKSVPDSAAAWARRNGCQGTPTRQSVAADVELTTYDCPADGAVVLYSILGGGHTWPGSALVTPEFITGTTTTSLDATRAIWDFFRAHPLPR
ncbi:alpha/beta hydrolase family esterase [Nocardia takedensis]|uniref:alpha/beta hydrolase family esterase n=1 Tax=Nocardia takedensis TaxID=259390 RepID=UPI000593B481|nr:hypothetical protein [Nocardia takedensis]